MDHYFVQPSRVLSGSDLVSCQWALVSSALASTVSSVRGEPGAELLTLLDSGAVPVRTHVSHALLAPNKRTTPNPRSRPQSPSNTGTAWASWSSALHCHRENARIKVWSNGGSTGLPEVEGQRNWYLRLGPASPPSCPRASPVGVFRVGFLNVVLQLHLRLFLEFFNLACAGQTWMIWRKKRTANCPLYLESLTCRLLSTSF